MEDGEMNEGELSSELTGLNKGQTALDKKKLMIGIGIVGALIIIAVIIAVAVSTSKKKGEEKGKDKSQDDDDKEKTVIGEIRCLLDVSSSFRETMIIGEDYSKKSEFDIFVDDNKLGKYSKTYTFNTTGSHNVTIKLYEDINMDYMFKGLDDIIAVYLTSNGKCQITSMISTFEKCENLYLFRIEGFKADKLKSMHKVFLMQIFIFLILYHLTQQI